MVYQQQSHVEPLLSYLHLQKSIDYYYLQTVSRLCPSVAVSMKSGAYPLESDSKRDYLEKCMVAFDSIY